MGKNFLRRAPKSYQFWSFLLAAMLTFGFTACSEIDNPSYPTGSVADEVVGAWYAEYQQSGTVYQGEDQDKLVYASVVQYYQFEADGTGVWTKFLFDADGKCIMQYGSMVGIDPDGAFTYTVSPDGKINVTLLHNYADDQSWAWSLTYADGMIAGKDGGAAYSLSRATAEQTAAVKATDESFHGGGLTGSDRLRFERKEFVASGNATTFTFEYPSMSYTGEDILLSAVLVAWTPTERQAGDKIETVNIYNHFTITADRECPTSSLTQGDTQEQNLLKMMCMADYGSRVGVPAPFVGKCITIAPDYEGYGLTKDRVHPYMAQELTAQQVVDAVTYGLELYRKEVAQAGSTLLPMSDDWRSFAFGYSQGGSTSLAVQHYLEETGLDETLHFQGSICGDGPYDLIATLRYYFDDNGDSLGAATAHKKGIMTMPVVLPLIIKGMVDSEPELTGYKIEDFLSQQFLDTGIIDWLTSKDYSTEDIEKKLVEQVENGLTANGRTYTPEQMAEMMELTTISNMFGTNKTTWGKAEKLFTPECYAYFANADNFKTVPAKSTDACTALHRALARNSITSGWQPKHRIVFLHSKGDMVVPYSNYLSFRDAHAAGEGRLFKVYDDSFSFSDHIDGGFTFFTNMGLIHSFAEYFLWLTE